MSDPTFNGIPLTMVSSLDAACLYQDTPSEPRYYFLREGAAERLAEESALEAAAEGRPYPVFVETRDGDATVLTATDGGAPDA